jgi:chromosome segregation ATPase
MKALSAELIAILTVGVVLSGVILTTTSRLNSRIDGLDARLRVLEQGQAILIERTGTMDIRLKVIEDGHAIVRAELASLREQQASLAEQQASLAEQQASLAERLARVEGLLEGLRIALDRRLPPPAE